MLRHARTVTILNTCVQGILLFNYAKPVSISCCHMMIMMTTINCLVKRSTDKNRYSLFPARSRRELLTMANLPHPANRTWTCAKPKQKLRSNSVQWECSAVIITTPRSPWHTLQWILLYFAPWCHFQRLLDLNWRLLFKGPFDKRPS